MSTLSFAVVAVVVFLAATSSATDVNSCLSGSGKQEVDIAGCTKGPCILKKGKSAVLQVQFVATESSKALKNKVSAKVFGIELPFPGVDGSDACSQIFNLDGTSAPCPLTAGQTYVYKNEFPVLKAYPTIRTTVHWALKGTNSDTPVCFNVKAKIQN